MRKTCKVCDTVCLNSSCSVYITTCNGCEIVILKKGQIAVDKKEYDKLKEDLERIKKNLNMYIDFKIESF